MFAKSSLAQRETDRKSRVSCNARSWSPVSQLTVTEEDPESLNRVGHHSTVLQRLKELNQLLANLRATIDKLVPTNTSFNPEEVPKNVHLDSQKKVVRRPATVKDCEEMEAEIMKDLRGLLNFQIFQNTHEEAKEEADSSVDGPSYKVESQEVQGPLPETHSQDDVKAQARDDAPTTATYVTESETVTHWPERKGSEDIDTSTDNPLENHPEFRMIDEKTPRSGSEVSSIAEVDQPERDTAIYNTDEETINMPETVQPETEPQTQAEPEPVEPITEKEHFEPDTASYRMEEETVEQTMEEERQPDPKEEAGDNPQVGQTDLETILPEPVTIVPDTAVYVTQDEVVEKSEEPEEAVEEEEQKPQEQEEPVGEMGPDTGVAMQTSVAYVVEEDHIQQVEVPTEMNNTGNLQAEEGEKETPILREIKHRPDSAEYTIDEVVIVDQEPVVETIRHRPGSVEYTIDEVVIVKPEEPVEPKEVEAVQEKVENVPVEQEPVVETKKHRPDSVGYTIDEIIIVKPEESAEPKEVEAVQEKLENVPVEEEPVVETKKHRPDSVGYTIDEIIIVKPEEPVEPKEVEAVQEKVENVPVEQEPVVETKSHRPDSVGYTIDEIIIVKPEEPVEPKEVEAVQEKVENVPVEQEPVIETIKHTPDSVEHTIHEVIIVKPEEPAEQKEVEAVQEKAENVPVETIKHVPDSVGYTIDEVIVVKPGDNEPEQITIPPDAAKEFDDKKALLDTAAYMTEEVSIVKPQVAIEHESSSPRIDALEEEKAVAVSQSVVDTAPFVRHEVIIEKPEEPIVDGHGTPEAGSRQETEHPVTIDRAEPVTAALVREEIVVVRPREPSSVDDAVVETPIVPEIAMRPQARYVTEEAIIHHQLVPIAKEPSEEQGKDESEDKTGIEVVPMTAAYVTEDATIEKPEEEAEEETTLDDARGGEHKLESIPEVVVSEHGEPVSDTATYVREDAVLQHSNEATNDLVQPSVETPLASEPTEPSQPTEPAKEEVQVQPTTARYVVEEETVQQREGPQDYLPYVPNPEANNNTDGSSSVSGRPAAPIATIDDDFFKHSETVSVPQGETLRIEHPTEDEGVAETREEAEEEKEEEREEVKEEPIEECAEYHVDNETTRVEVNSEGQIEEETKDPDNAPLIGQGEETDKENMPFGFLKKKSDGGLKADLETIKMDAEKEVEKVEVKDEEKPKEATEEVANEVKAEEAVQVADAGNKEEEAKAEVSGQTVVPQTAPKTENSPLITEGEEGKESKLKDQQPGFLCCNIL